jgi:hypothetical protein
MEKTPLDTAVAAENTQGRSSMGRAATTFTSPSASPASGKLMPRKNTQAGDPAIENQGTRKYAPISASERNGAAHTVIASIVKQNEPSAGETQANGRIIPASTKRSQLGSFGEGMGTSY